MRRVVLGVVLALAFAACSRDSEVGSSPAAVDAWSGDLPIAAPWLRGQLPPTVLSYQRLPHPFGLIAIPKGNGFNAALGSDANIRNLVAIQQGIEQNLVTQVPLLDDPRADLLIGQLRSPVEIAAYGLPSPSALIAMTLKARTNADVEALFGRLAQTEPPLELAAPLDANGIGEVVGLPLSCFVRFEQSTGRLLMLVGAGLTAGSFQLVLDGLPAAGAQHAMHALEQRIDSSGQGWFGWVDMTKALSMAQMFTPAETLQGLEALGLSNMQAVAYGAGVANGKGRLSLLVDVGTNRASRPFPVVANNVTATSVGEPDAAAVLSLPSPAEFARLEAMFLAAVPGAAEGLRQAKDQLREYTGIGIEDVLAAVGPELVLVFDSAGDYSAVRVRDQALFDELVAKVSAKTGVPPVSQNALGATFQHWSLPSTYTLASSANPDGDPAFGVLARMREHVYWTRDGDYLYAASVPQPLMDRVRAGADTNIGEWLANRQRIDVSTSVLAATGKIPKLPRRMYHVYVQMMQSLADLAAADYDVWSMPTADQLALANAGSIGFTMNLGEPYVSLELSYESHPAELFFGAGGLGSVAVVGILAAIAIPAYQDYTMRAQLSVGLAEASAVQVAVAEAYQNTGRFPNAAVADGLSNYDPAPPVAAITVEANTGTIVVEFLPGAVPGDGEIRFEPEAQRDRTLTWQCSGTIPPRYLPAACR
jgi:type II secretory pathway pseudopilin PulG